MTVPFAAWLICRAGGGTSASRLAIFGAGFLSTVTRCSQVVMLKLASVTVQTTRVTPGGNSAGALLATDTASQLSLATTVPSPGTATGSFPFAEMVKSGGHVTLGGS